MENTYRRGAEAQRNRGVLKKRKCPETLQDVKTKNKHRGTGTRRTAFNNVLCIVSIFLRASVAPCEK